MIYLVANSWSPWRLSALLTAIAFVSHAQESLNLMFEDTEGLDLSVLGTNNLNRYDGEYEVDVDTDCKYFLTLKFKHDSNNPQGAAGFQNSCDPSNTALASDGLRFHDPRRNWIQFPEYIRNTIEFDHLSLDWKPCGLPPQGFRQARYDISLYTVSPEYRYFMTCEEESTPSACKLNQTSWVGRRMFSLPTMAKSPSILANMPISFQPHLQDPLAIAHEGLVSFGREAQEFPSTVNNWYIPRFQMMSHDGNVISWRGLVAYDLVSGLTGEYEIREAYSFQTLPQLPSYWKTSYNANTKLITLNIQGDAALCRQEYLDAKQEFEASTRK